MKRSLARILSPSTAVKLLPSIHFNKPNPRHIASPIFSSSTAFNPAGRSFSSETPSKPSQSNLEQSQTKYETSDAQYVSNEELKKQIHKMYDGDEDAFVSVFEAILRRKLDGNSEKLDEQLLKELPNRPRAYNSEDDNESDSD